MKLDLRQIFYLILNSVQLFPRVQHVAWCHRPNVCSYHTNQHIFFQLSLTCEIPSSYLLLCPVSLLSLSRSRFITLFLQAAFLLLKLRFMLLAEETRLPLISVNIEESTSQAPLLSQVKNSMLDGRLDGLARLKLSSDSVKTPSSRKTQLQYIHVSLPLHFIYWAHSKEHGENDGKCILGRD